MGAWTHRLTNIDPDTRTATCSACGTVGINRRSDGGWRCRRAHRAQRGTPSAASNGRRRRRHHYGLGPADFDALVLRSEGRCECCGRDFPSSYGTKIDHDHASGVVRGLLCHSCNTGLGQLGDTVEGLQRALAYLIP